MSIYNIYFYGEMVNIISELSSNTVITLSIGNGRPLQTVKTQIRCDRMQCLIKVYTAIHTTIF